MLLLKVMNIPPKKINPSEIQTSMPSFLKSYNETIPKNFPQASVALLEKYKDEHSAYFKHGDSWSLDMHRKKVMDWLPGNSETQ